MSLVNKINNNAFKNGVEIQEVDVKHITEMTFTSPNSFFKKTNLTWTNWIFYLLGFIPRPIVEELQTNFIFYRNKDIELLAVAKKF